jgi:hypothetical protein
MKPETRDMLLTVGRGLFEFVVLLLKISFKVAVVVLMVIGAIFVGLAGGSVKGLMKGARRPYNRRYWQSGGAWR